MPLVFDFHGYGSNAVQQMIYGNFKPQANVNNFLVVGPDGQVGTGGRHFNLGNEPGLQKDIDMVQALMTHLEATLCVDAARVYSTGMSDGGAMTSVLACRLPGKFAAFAAVAAVIYCGAKGARPSRVRGVHGHGRSHRALQRRRGELLRSSDAAVGAFGHGQLGCVQRLRQASSPTAARE